MWLGRRSPASDPPDPASTRSTARRRWSAPATTTPATGTSAICPRPSALRQMHHCPPVPARLSQAAPDETPRVQNILSEPEQSAHSAQYFLCVLSVPPVQYAPNHALCRGRLIGSIHEADQSAPTEWLFQTCFTLL